MLEFIEPSFESRYFRKAQQATEANRNTLTWQHRKWKLRKMWERQLGWTYLSVFVCECVSVVLLMWEAAVACLITFVVVSSSAARFSFVFRTVASYRSYYTSSGEVYYEGAECKSWENFRNVLILGFGFQAKPFTKANIYCKMKTIYNTTHQNKRTTGHANAFVPRKALR